MPKRAATVAAVVLAALALVLSVAAVHPAKAYADTTIGVVELKGNLNTIPMNAATTGKEANDAFKAVCDISTTTATMCSLDRNYSFVVEKTGTASTGGFFRKTLFGSTELLTSGKEYYAVYNLIMKSGYTFPGSYSAGSLSCSSLKVKLNGSLRSDAHIEWYNSDSVDIYIPLKFDSSTRVESIDINPSEIYMQKGTNRLLEATVKGSSNAELIWTMENNATSGSYVTSTGRVYIGSNEPAYRVITVTAKSKDFPNIKATCKITVINSAPSITSVKATPSTRTADVSKGIAAVIPVTVEIEGTADHTYQAVLTGNNSANTKIINKGDTSFEIQVAPEEDSANLAVTVAASADTSKNYTFIMDVVPVQRVNNIDLMINTEVLNKSTSITVAQFEEMITSENVWTTNANTHVDYPYCHLYTRAWNGSGYTYTRASETSIVNAASTYYLGLNIEEGKYYNDSCYWPSSLDSIAVTANGQNVGTSYGFGDVKWYSRSISGSVEVYIPVRAAQVFEKPEWEFSVAKRIAAVNYNGSITKAAYAIKAIKNSDGKTVLTVASDGTIHWGEAYSTAGAVTYSKASGSKYLSITTKGITPGVTTGKITVAPKTPVGEYKIKVCVTMAADAHHKATSKVVEMTVQVKRFTPTITVTSKIRPNKNYSATEDQTVTMIKAVQCAAKPLTYSIVKVMDADGKKVSDSLAAKFSVDPATGVVTFKAGTPRGTYKVMFKISSPAVDGYNANWRTATGTFQVV